MHLKEGAAGLAGFDQKGQKPRIFNLLCRPLKPHSGSVEINHSMKARLIPLIGYCRVHSYFSM
jgi:hypothetical protein